MAERSRFAVRATSAVPIVGIGVLAAIMLPLLGGGIWLVVGPVMGGLAVLSQLVRPKGTVLIIDKQGFTDRRIRTDMILWKLVEGVDRVKFRNVDYINIRLNRAGAEVVMLPQWRRLFTPVYSMLGIAPVHVTASALDGSPNEVYTALFNSFSLAGRAEQRLTPQSIGVIRRS